LKNREWRKRGKNRGKKGVDDSMAGLVVADGGLDDGGCEMNANNMSGGAHKAVRSRRERERE